MLETINNTLKTTGQRHPSTGIIPAQGVNTLGEVMDGDWYVNRHATRRMTIEELQRGPGNDVPPAVDGPWQVLVVKPFGVNQGLLIADAKRDLYLLRFDPPGYEGLATGAEMVTSRFLYALGYHVPENYLVRFERSRLVANAEGQTVSSAGRPRRLVPADIDCFLRGMCRSVRADVPRRGDARAGAPRGAASARTKSGGRGATTPTTPCLTNTGATSAGCSCSRPGSTTAARAPSTRYDILTPVDGVTRLRHYLIDFTRSLGSGVQRRAEAGLGRVRAAISPELAVMRRNIAGPRLVTPAWMKAEVSRSARGWELRQRNVRTRVRGRPVQPIPPSRTACPTTRSGRRNR